MADPVSSVAYAMEAALRGLDGQGLLASRFRTINRFHLPAWGIAVLAAISTALVARASSALRWRPRSSAGKNVDPFATAISAGGTLAVAVLLVLNLRRLDPILSLGTAAIVSVYLWRSWVAHGRPGGIPRVTT
jgi:hypothetical protein